MGESLGLLDSNILLRWAQDHDPDYAVVSAALNALRDAGQSLCYTSQNLGEFWNAATRPARQNGFGLSPFEADKRARSFESRLRLLPDNLAVHEEWRALLVKYKVSGVQVHDARLAAAMIVHGVPRILTFDCADFARFSEVEAVHPDQFAP